MNRLTAAGVSLALGLTNAKCSADASIDSNSQAVAASADVVTGDISRISTDASGKTDAVTNNADAKSDGGKDTVNTAPDKNPCNKLGVGWKTVLAGEYFYNPPPKIGTDRATLEGVSKQDVLALTKLMKDKVITQLCYAQETVNPVNSEGNAVRVCDNIDVQYNGPETPENQDVYAICHIKKELLPQGPKLNPNYDESILEDEISISSNTALKFTTDENGNSQAVSHDEPAIYKNRLFKEKDGSISGNSFFLTGGNQGPEYGTGDFKRRSRIWISGK